MIENEEFVDEDSNEFASKKWTDGTVGALMKEFPLLPICDLDDDILAMKVTDGCAVDCIEVMRAGQTLADLAADYRHEIVSATIKQVRCFYFG